jgi:methylated-DNA-[protein]-cysteine S-methyltransferase
VSTRREGGRTGPARPWPARVYAHLPSPVGRLLLTADDAGLRGLFMAGSRDYPESLDGLIEDATWFRAAAEQIAAYFAGELTTFQLPLTPGGTAFQQEVWRALVDIPYGATTTYAALAAVIGRPTAVRAVGAANGQNPIPIVIPCHRLVGRDGSLTGYGGGLWRKEWLLGHERGHAGADAQERQ